MYHIAVLWGLDGALVDTRAAAAQHARASALAFGVKLDELAIDAPVEVAIPDGAGGTAALQVIPRMAGDRASFYDMCARSPSFANEVGFDQWVAARQQACRGLEGLFSARDQSVAMVLALAWHDTLQAAITNHSPGIADLAMKSLGEPAKELLFVEHGDSQPLPRPAPHVYKHAAQRLAEIVARQKGPQFKPLVLCVEGSSEGVSAALSAGLHTVQFLRAGERPCVPSLPIPKSLTFRAVRDLSEFARIVTTLAGV